MRFGRRNWIPERSQTHFQSALAGLKLRPNTCGDDDVRFSSKTVQRAVSRTLALGRRLDTHEAAALVKIHPETLQWMARALSVKVVQDLLRHANSRITSDRCA